LATMSHEIRTPMNAVLGMNDLLIHSPLQAEQRVWAETVQASGRHLLGVINDVLDFSRIESGQLTLEVIDFDVVEVVQDVLLMFTQPAQDKGLALFAHFTPVACPMALRGDPLRLRQILMNLIGNALKFTHQGSVQVYVTLLDRTEQDVALTICVTDSGIGIAPEDQARIFEHFSQADSSTTRNYGGTGLGLAISRRLLSLMGGRMGVVSAPGQGASFEIDLRLPLAQAVPEPWVVDRAHTSAHALASMAPVPLRGTVLLVEDNLTNQLVACAMLKMLGLNWQLAQNGEQALAMVRHTDFDLVLMDCQMPVMDGFEATALIRQLPQGQRLPIIALTANTLHGDSQKCLAAGMDAFLPKPYTLDTLRTLLSRWLTEGAVADQDALAPCISLAFIDSLHQIDVASGMSLSRELFPAYLAIAALGMSQIEQALDSGNTAALGKAAHALKSSAANVGALVLSNSYRELEQLCREDRLDDARALFPRVHREHLRACAEIDQLLMEIV
jgi:CheY-like chemotaxis protein/HPt (histidine-containing phosphotransfer) domain-containing protein